MSGELLSKDDKRILIEEECVKLLKQYGLTVSTMESCTGGMVASRLIGVAGASDVLKAGYITYCDEAKHEILGVSEDTLKCYTAVSSQTADEMVQGRALAMKPDVAVSVTGIAGPGGGTAEKPVGTVYIGCRVKEQVCVKECRFGGKRQSVREKAAEEALQFLKDCINGYFL